MTPVELAAPVVRAAHCSPIRAAPHLDIGRGLWPPFISRRRSIEFVRAFPGAQRPLARQRIPCVIVPGFLSGASSYQAMAQNLRTLGFDAEVVPITRFDWYPTLGGASFEKLLDKMQLTVTRMHAERGRLALVCHSAGGFLARILLGSQPYCGKVYGLSPFVSTLVTLGTPHRSLEAYPFGRVPENRPREEALEMPEAARGSSLQFANHFYPRGNAFPQTCIACVVGRSIKGEDLRLRDVISNPGSAREALTKYIAFSAYQASCGDGRVWGDGVTPVDCAFLEGAERILLEGIRHGPNARGPWYGDLEVAVDWSKQVESLHVLR